MPVDETDAFPVSAAPPAPQVDERPRHLPWWLALLQVILVSGIPTQLVIAAVLALAAGMPLIDSGGQLSFEFFAILSFTDTAAIALLILLFLSLSGETSRAVFLGVRPIWGEVLRGLALLPIVFIAVSGIVLGIRAVAPWMHTVTTSPLEAFMRTPLETAIFTVVVVLAGGVREELQRAFILHRFEQGLGGVRLGLVIFSLTFGALHVDQGVDVAVAIGALGFLWGVLYIRRRSALTAMVNHASFNAAQVLQAVIARSLGA
jgi:membrane protease YdiL (CAAX protease family)